jgi:hypothetical protein
MQAISASQMHFDFTAILIILHYATHERFEITRRQIRGRIETHFVCAACFQTGQKAFC